jgi:prepilin-type N-terminal cleavage/methylation domain-containing protein
MVSRRVRSGSVSPDTSRSSENPASREAGFTLVEVIVAVLVLTIGLVAMAELLAVSIRLHQLSRNTEVATQLAQGKFEELMKLNFTTAPAVQPGGSLTNNVANHFDAPVNTFTRRWLVQAGPAARTLRVTVRVVPAQTDLRMLKPVELTSIIRQW